MTQRICFLYLFFISYIAFSQEGYEVGYIITNSGDTIKGKIKDRKYIPDPPNSDKIKFIDAKGKKCKITPDKVSEYCRKGILFFRTLPIGMEGKQKFAQVLEYGEVILFGYIDNSFVSATISSVAPTGKDKTLTTKRSVVYFFQKRKDEKSLMKVKKDKFKDISLFYFKNDTELIKKLEDKSLSFEDIRLVVKTYNEFAEKK